MTFFFLLHLLKLFISTQNSSQMGLLTAPCFPAFIYRCWGWTGALHPNAILPVFPSAGVLVILNASAEIPLLTGDIHGLLQCYMKFPSSYIPLLLSP